MLNYLTGWGNLCVIYMLVDDNNKHRELVASGFRHCLIVVPQVSNMSYIFEKYVHSTECMFIWKIWCSYRHSCHLITGNHYKWDWPKSQFSMPDDSATVVWLRNLKVGNVYLFNFLQNTLKKLSFWKWEIRKLENVIFPSSAEPCRILQNSALVPQNSAEHFSENHEILRISAEFRRMVFVPQNYSAELQNVIIFCRSLRNWANLFCGIVRECLVPQNSSAELFIINPFCGILQNQLVRFCRILWNSAD